jgi:membrane protein
MKVSYLKPARRKLRVTWDLLCETFAEWNRDNAMQLAATLAFYTVFSFAPILILLVAAASSVFGREAVRTEVMHELDEVLSRSGAAMVQTVLENARPASSKATLMGLGAMLFGATAVFVALQDALNQVWGVAVKPGKAIRLFFRKRLLSFLILVVIGILLLASTILDATLRFAGDYLKNAFPELFVLDLMQFGVSVALAAIMFGLIFKVLPDVKIAWADVWIGALVTSILFNIGKMLIGLYLARSTVGSLYGAAGSFAVFLIWIYYSAQVFFIGAEFTRVYARRRGTPIIPDSNAVSFRIETYSENSI